MKDCFRMRGFVDLVLFHYEGFLQTKDCFVMMVFVA